MPDHSAPSAPTPFPGPRLGRRAVLTSGLAVAGGALLSGAVGHAASARPGRGAPPAGASASLDVAGADGLETPELLRLRIDDTDPTAQKAAPGQLVLTTTASQGAAMVVATTKNRVDLSTERDAGRSKTVTVEVVPGRKTVIWVFPRDVGDPGEPADQLHVFPEAEVGDADKTRTVDVWTEPVGGQWRPLKSDDGTTLDLGIVAVHAALMRKKDNTGTEVVMYSPPRQREGGTLKQNPKWSPTNPERTERWMWDAAAMGDVEARALDVGSLQVRDTTRTPKKNIFCSGLAHLPDGSLFVVGGHIRLQGSSDHQHGTDNGTLLNVYDGDGWTSLDPLKLGEARWYPTVTTLPDGRMLIATGSGDGFWTNAYWLTINEDYRVYDPKTNTLSPVVPLTTADAKDQHGQLLRPEGLAEGDELWSTKLGTYPGVYPLPGPMGSGAVVAMVECNRGWLYDLRADHGDRPLEPQHRFHRMNSKGSRGYPWYGAPVLLPLHPDRNQYAILVPGGQDENDPKRTRSHHTLATRTAEVFDIDLDQPADGRCGWSTLQMRQRRYLCDATLLADGTVLISGGAQKGWSDENLDYVYDAELFDPERRTFTQAAGAHTTRRYHAVALLLPDGSVLKAGSTGGFAEHPTAEKWFRSRTDAEVYYPPYLWRGPRPVITPAGAAQSRVVRYGTQFEITAAGTGLDTEAKVGLIRLGATTHGYNSDQRYVWLKSIRQTGDPDERHLTAAAPTNGAVAPPGDYLLVVVDHLGVPSEGELVRVE